MTGLTEGNSMTAKGNRDWAEGMRWTCGQAGHPRQHPDDAACICGTWSRHVEAGAVVVELTGKDDLTP